MSEQMQDASERFRKKFETYKELAAQFGEQAAWETLLNGYPERQKRQMGPYIDDASLAAGLRRAIPAFRKLGMEMEVVDISTPSVDAALEVQRICPVLNISTEYGFARPCRIICEMDVEATRRAFRDMSGEILCTKADGACVCVFKYERRAQESPSKANAERVTE
jgi:predicted ArsR family transcriptional regulator